MQVLIFDTETSGLNSQWNVILQLSYQIVDTSSWISVKEVNHYFPWPQEERRVSEEAIGVNGLTKQRLKKEQLSDRKSALEEFISDMSKCELVVAHNLEFDKGFIINECKRVGIENPEYRWVLVSTYDTMIENTDYCAIPKTWGHGYKRPKLSELAGCLGVDYTGLSLHDSSCDVELTKRCFKSLTKKGIYKPSIIEIEIIVNSPTDIQYIAVDSQGNKKVSEDLLEIGITKSRQKSLARELLKRWTIETEDERRDYINIHKKISLPLKTVADYQSQLDEACLENYSRKIFSEPEPSKEVLEQELWKEAKSKVFSILFWRIKRMRQQYVDNRLESMYARAVQDYNERKCCFEQCENAEEIKFVKHLDNKKSLLQGLIGGDKDCLMQSLSQISTFSDFPLSHEVNYDIVDDSTVIANVKLPDIKEISRLRGVEMSSGNYKVKEISDKDLRKDYLTCITGLALYTSAKVLNASPTVKFVKINAFISDVDSINSGRNYLYSVTIDRDRLEDSISTKDKDDFSPVDALLAFNPNMNISAKTGKIIKKEI